MEIQVGEYVRAMGIIAKLVKKEDKGNKKTYYFDRIVLDNFDVLSQYGIDQLVRKHSFEIIDLIEEGDYVNGKEVSVILKDKEGNTTDVCYYEEAEEQTYSLGDIKSVLTKEQFKSMEYEVK